MEAVVAPSSSVRTIALMYVIEALSGLSRGAYLVCIGWTTLMITGDVAKVGQVFVISMLTILLVSHVIGVMVDRYDRKAIMLLGHTLIGSVMIILGWSMTDAETFKPSLMFLAVAVLTFGRIAYEIAYEVTLKEVIPDMLFTRTFARTHTVHLVFTACATVLIGWCLGNFDIRVSFFVTGFFSALVVGAVSVLPRIKLVESIQKRPSMSEFALSFKILKEVPQLLPLVLLAGLALPIGQLSNAILSSFVHNDLGQGSWEFGVVDSAWPIGGLIASFSIGLLPVDWTAKIRISLATTFIALSTIFLAMSSNLVLLAILHGAMGLFTWMSRILINARVLEIVPLDKAGRATSNVTFAFSLIAILMCFSPSLVSGLSTRTYFLFWGAAILAATLLYELNRCRRNCREGSRKAGCRKTL